MSNYWSDKAKEDSNQGLWNKIVNFVDKLIKLRNTGTIKAQDGGPIPSINSDVIDTAWSTVCDLIQIHVSPSLARKLRGSQTLSKTELLKEFSKLSANNAKSLTSISNEIGSIQAALNNASYSAPMQRTGTNAKAKLRQAYNKLSNANAVQGAIDTAQNIASRAGEDLTVHEAKAIIEPYAQIIEERIK